MSKSEEFYKNLKEKLEESTTFPSKYMYKFIVPTTKNQVNEVQEAFNGKGAVINTKASKNGKFVSVSIVLNVKSADEVIVNYKSISHVEGLISL